MVRDELVIGRLDALIARAGEVAPMGDGGWSIFRAFTAQVRTAMADVAGADSDYYKLISNDVERVRSVHDGATMIESGLKALRDDVEAGYLRRTADLIAAEVFGDFLDMAEYLLEKGYHVPAASLLGAVLEDGLKRLAARNDVAVKSRDDISAVNHRLADKQVYSNLQRKQIGVWADVRNHADHGEFDKISQGDVRDMYTGVIRFLAEHLG